MKRPFAAALPLLFLHFLAAASPEPVPVFPDAEAGADPAIPAGQGGRGFNAIAAALGWTTNPDFPPIGDPRARKGGDLVTTISDYPGGMRPVGPQANQYLLIWSFETLLARHPATLEWVPLLASHWKIAPDGLAASFRIDPNARWPDGTPVTSRDVIATYDFYTDETAGEPWRGEELRPYGRPVASGPYLVTVPLPSKGWRAFYNLNCVPILPASALAPFRTAGDFSGSKAADFLCGSGPYEMRAEDQADGQAIILHRRAGHWNVRGRVNAGCCNFDRIVLKVVPDDAIALERLKKGEFNMLCVDDPARWVREITPEKVPLLARGRIRKAAFPIRTPGGFSGLALNMTRPPLDDLRVRKALALLMDRKRIIRMLFHDQVIPVRSYWAGTRYANPENPANDHDPAAAMALLADAGWRRNPGSGLLEKADGSPLRFRLTYSNPDNERFLTVYQESLKQAGITLTLDPTAPARHWSLMDERKFEIATYGGFSSEPEPGILFLGAHARKTPSSNVWGFSDPRVDGLIGEYESVETGRDADLVRILREIDGLLAAQYPMILTWRSPETRILHRETLRPPAKAMSAFGAPLLDVVATWWHDGPDE